jgi:hypothetical protein
LIGELEQLSRGLLMGRAKPNHGRERSDRHQRAPSDAA